MIAPVRVDRPSHHAGSVFAVFEFARPARYAVALFAALLAVPAAAQPQEAVGIYDGGQMELAASLELKADGRFAYWVSYGAVDEVSQGTWRSAEGGIVLDSDPVTAPKFEVTAHDAGEPKVFSVDLEVPGGLPREGFSALITLADGDSFVADFTDDGLAIPLTGDQRVAKVVFGLPMFEVRSEEIEIAPGDHHLAVRFVPNDLGVVDFDKAALPFRDGAYVLQRFDRTIRFRKVEP